MLILMRRTGETIVIGEDGPDQIRITILGVKGHQVRIGCTAKKSTSIHREEIFERIKREQQDGEVSDVPR